MFRNQKGQGMTEFALILPLLLLLLLGIVEAGRTIWAYITVQQAAREAARFAVTGRPYLNGNDPDGLLVQTPICRYVFPPEDGSDVSYPEEPNPINDVGIQPWLCLPEDRVEAIKRIALSQGRNLAISRECTTPEQYRGEDPDECSTHPGAFGVFIQGQITTGTITTTIEVQEDHPGQEGLVIQVNTFYNLQMITPIFDAIMGGEFIQLLGSVQLQNEGLDAAAGIEPPPGIAPPPAPGDDNLGGDLPTARIISTQGYQDKSQSDPLFIRLDDHAQGQYAIFLEGSDGVQYRICETVTVGPSGSTTDDALCSLAAAEKPNPSAPPPFVSADIPPGFFYDLYSTVIGTTGPRVATADTQVEVISGGDPIIEVAGGSLWAANETTQVTLRFHEVISGTTYDVKLFTPDGSEFLLATNHSGLGSSLIDWTVQDLLDLGIAPTCQIGEPDTCRINSFVSGSSTPIATTTVRINQPYIDLSLPSNGSKYVRGESVNITLKRHTPGNFYNIKIPSPLGADLIFTTGGETDAEGDAAPRAWIIPQDCGFGSGWPNGDDYGITSHPLGQTPEITGTTFDVFTNSTDENLTVDGGTTWTAGSTINFRVLRHLENTEHYIEFDGVRIPTGASNDAFFTGTCGDAIVPFFIPPTTIAGSYLAASYDITGTLQAMTTVNVLAKPFIYVLEGDVVLPDQTVNIQGTSHVPGDTYAIYYADKFLRNISADSIGTFTFPYNIQDLPLTPGPDLTDFNNLGIPYILKSQTTVTPIFDVATSTLTIQGADLVVTQVNVASVAPYSTTVPVEIVVQNTMPVTIDRFVDVDFYDLDIPDPDPFGPSYLAGYNFPGDIKFWKNTVKPNEVFTFSHQILVSELGLRNLYGYADISNNVFENESAGQVANPNNINNSSLLVNCPAVVTSDNFSSGALSGWTLTDYGNASSPSPSATASGILALRSAGSSTWQSNDNSGGQSLLYRTTAFSSSFGLDVQVMVSDVDLVGNWAKGGLEIRDSLSSTSPRVVLGVARRNNANSDPRHVIQAGYRNTGNSMDWVAGDNFWLNNHRVDLNPDAPNQGPVWLRITRDPGSNGAFNFFYVANPATPPPAVDNDAAQQTYWGSPVQSVSVSGIGDNVVVGLFNASYSASTAGTTDLDNFSIAAADVALCSSSAEADAQPFPPKYVACDPVLNKTSFEETVIVDAWKFPGNGAGVPKPGGVQLFTSGGHIGTRSLRTWTLEGDFFTPHFYQQFTMPDWVISTTTTFDVNLYKRIGNLGNGPDPNDEFYVTVVTTNEPGTWTPLTTPELVAQGVGTSGWVPLTARLTVAGGINLEDYANQDLYLYFYNNSNPNIGSTTCGGGLCQSEFFFDDIQLEVCTAEPEPSPISTQITGKLTLNFSDNTSEALPFVRVWAYAQGTAQGTQPVYETFSIQNGEFNFYNIPFGTYTIFAQYNLVQGTQIETLSADTTVTLNGSNNPANVFLNMFTLAPLPPQN